MKIIALSLSQLLALALAQRAADAAANEKRKLAHFDNGTMEIITLEYPPGLDDRARYATGIIHPEYPCQGDVVIVGEYQSADVAKLGHTGWVLRMTTLPLPAHLRDVVLNANVARIMQEPADFDGEEDTQPGVPMCVIR